MTTLPLIYEKDGRKSAIFLVVVDSVGTPQTVVAGRRLEGDGEILVDRSLADRFDLQPGDDLSIVLFYDLIDQGGLELQRTRGDWLWKGEALLRSGQGPTFGAFTLAFEHTSWGAFGTEIDLGSLVELSYDGRENSTFNFYDEDLFGGLRLSFNDAAGTEILGAVVTDLESGTALGSVEASRRLGPQWTIEFVGRVFVSDDPQDPVHWFRRDHYLQTVVEYYL